MSDTKYPPHMRWGQPVLFAAITALVVAFATNRVLNGYVSVPLALVLVSCGSLLTILPGWISSVMKLRELFDRRSETRARFAAVIDPGTPAIVEIGIRTRKPTKWLIVDKESGDHWEWSTCKWSWVRIHEGLPDGKLDIDGDPDV